jgi:hypothetical protein
MIAIATDVQNILVALNEFDWQFCNNRAHDNTAVLPQNRVVNMIYVGYNNKKNALLTSHEYQANDTPTEYKRTIKIMVAPARLKSKSLSIFIF